MYSTVGSLFATACIKLSPIHRRLSELEVTNIRDFFNSDFISTEKRRQLDRFQAFMMTYFNAIWRMKSLTKEARQDYYALQRQGCFVTSSLQGEPADHCKIQTPILVVPGLNTPTVFFREMHSYFSRKGYPVFVLELPGGGLSDVASCAQALKAEIQRLQETYHYNQFNIIGHCLGGLIANYWLESDGSAKQPVQNLISLGTGFLGAEGVEQLKNLWIPRNPGKVIPKVFDELIQANMNMIQHSKEVTRHNLLTIWDFMVHFRKGIMEATPDLETLVANHIIEDPDVDHLTLVLNHRVFQRIETILSPQ